MTDYFFTITLKPTMYKVDIDKQFDETCNELYVALVYLSDKVTLVAELTTQGFNVHYHGIIQLQNTKRQFINYFRNDKKFGFVSCTPTINMEKIIPYISKDLQHTMEELQRRPIIKDDYNCFSTSQRLNFARQF